MENHEASLRLIYSHSIIRKRVDDPKFYWHPGRFSHKPNAPNVLQKMIRLAEIMFESSSYSDMQGRRFIQLMGNESQRSGKVRDLAETIAKEVQLMLADAAVEDHFFRNLRILLGIAPYHTLFAWEVGSHSLLHGEF